MQLNTLSPAVGAKKPGKRVGRGIGSGLGKTGGRGHKGQNSRSGGGVPILFEGGQSNFVLRTPKRGFKNYNRVEFEILNVGTLDKVSDSSEIDKELLVKLGKIEGKKPLKILGQGEISKKINIKADAFSKSAEEKIKSAGGTITSV